MLSIKERLVIALLSCIVVFVDYIDPGHAGYLAWTPISQPARSEVDLWTKTATGCSCPFNSKRKSCACCTQQGACHCGERVPNRCAQCGLEDQCDHMCNVTLDSRKLWESSRLLYGQIKSLELRNNQMCWYRFIPNTGLRVEIQLYRLIEIGHLNQSRCEGGSLEWITTGQRDGSHSWKLCALNERYSPPAVLYSDNDVTPATLILKTGDEAKRGRLLAHFSFTNITHETLGLRLKGASFIHGTDCAWNFQDMECITKYNNSCSIATPGYPGLYPPNKRCHYRIIIHSPFHQVALHFHVINLPPERCHSDNIRIYVNGVLNTTLCQQESFIMKSHGPEINVEFNSGFLLPPHLFNGFFATLQFSHILSTDHSANNTAPLTDRFYTAMERQPHAVCDYWIRSNHSVYSGFFTTSRTSWKVWPAPCTIAFVAQRGQSVQLSLFNYNLTGADCNSVIEIHNGALDVRWSSSYPRYNICSPITKNARNSQGRFTQPLLLESVNSSLSLRFRMDPLAGLEQILEGAFVFHEETYGKLEAGTWCDSIVDGQLIAGGGQIRDDFDSAIFWNAVGRLHCNTTFLPQIGQSISITVNTIQMADNNKCTTQCDDRGCHCHLKDVSLNDINHVTISKLETKQIMMCLCGNIQEWIPLTFVSNVPISIYRHMAHFHYGQPHLKMNFNYSFHHNRQDCGLPFLNSSGPIFFKKFPLALNSTRRIHYYTDCLWIVHPQRGEQWIFTLTSSQEGNCQDWNTTFYLYDEQRQKFGQNIGSICSESDKNTFHIPTGMGNIAVRLQAWSSSLAEYQLDWQISQWSGPTPDVQRSLSSLISTSIPLPESNSTDNRNTCSSLYSLSYYFILSISCIQSVFTSYLRQITIQK